MVLIALPDEPLQLRGTHSLHNVLSVLSLLLLERPETWVHESHRLPKEIVLVRFLVLIGAQKENTRQA